MCLAIPSCSCGQILNHHDNASTFLLVDPDRFRAMCKPKQDPKRCTVYDIIIRKSGVSNALPRKNLQRVGTSLDAFGRCTSSRHLGAQVTGDPKACATLDSPERGQDVEPTGPNAADMVCLPRSGSAGCCRAADGDRLRRV